MNGSSHANGDVPCVLLNGCLLSLKRLYSLLFQGLTLERWEPQQGRWGARLQVTPVTRGRFCPIEHSLRWKTHLPLKRYSLHPAAIYWHCYTTQL